MTDVERMDTQLFEACACDMETMKVLLTELKDLKSQLAVPVSLIEKEIVEVVKPVPQRRAQHRTVEQVVAVLVRQIVEEIIEVTKVVFAWNMFLRGEKSRETVKDVRNWMDNHQLSEKDVSEVKLEKLAEMTQLRLQHNISEHVLERLVEVLVPQIREQCVEIAKVFVQKVFKLAHRRCNFLNASR